jgi:NAD-dependent dihydropyrimidine dehydrogenase PreA subunit
MKKGKSSVTFEPGISTPLVFNATICIGCNQCIEVCQMDILIPNPEKSKPPILAFPGECWYCGCCIGICPRPGAIKLNIPLMNKVHWKSKTPSSS